MRHHHIEPWSMHGASFFQMRSALRCSVLCTTCSSSNSGFIVSVDACEPSCAQLNCHLQLLLQCGMPVTQHAPPNTLDVGPYPSARAWHIWLGPLGGQRGRLSKRDIAATVQSVLMLQWCATHSAFGIYFTSSQGSQSS